MILGMTYYEFFVPVVALGVAALGTLYVHILSRRLDARIDAARKHPAE
jgi:hypothetical protein